MLEYLLHNNGTEGGGPNILTCIYQKQIFQICMKEIHDRIGKKKAWSILFV